MKWYDFFANFYDLSLEKLYFESRVEAASMLDLQAGQHVLDLACGTGANFEHLQAACNTTEIYASDYSSGMLKKAKKRIEKNEWSNITLFQADARTLSPERIHALLGKSLLFDRIICVLGLSVIPNWEAVMDSIISVLKPSGKIVIVDVYAEKRTLSSVLVEKIAKADLSRTIWQNLAAKTQNFEIKYAKVKAQKVGGKLFIAKGEKQDTMS